MLIRSSASAPQCALVQPQHTCSQLPRADRRLTFLQHRRLTVRARAPGQVDGRALASFGKSTFARPGSFVLHSVPAVSQDVFAEQDEYGGAQSHARSWAAALAVLTISSNSLWITEPASANDRTEEMQRRRELLAKAWVPT